MAEKPSVTTSVTTIKDRASFVRMNQQASRFVVSSFIVQHMPNPTLEQGCARIGFTVTKKMGGAVVRNRIKRRLREVVRAVAAPQMKPQHDYVFIARHGATQCDFKKLTRDMAFAFSKIKG